MSLFSLAALILFACLYPTHFLIADEVAYFEQALAWVQGSPASTVSTYPPGTSLLAAGWLLFFSPKAVFWCGILTWLTGIWALAFLLHRLGKPVIWALYPAIFLPGLVLTRTLMSDLPSFALASVFLWLYIGFGYHKWGLFAAGLVAGIALLFRETNALWAVPFMAGSILRGQAFWKIIWLGFAVGLIPRLTWGWYFFNDPLFVRDPGISFSALHLPQNASFYALSLLVLAPGGLYFLIKNKSPYRLEILAALTLFLGVYGCYGYDAFTKSGYKAVVLQGRFLLPLLPLAALAAAEQIPEIGRRMQVVLGIAAFSFFAGIQVLGNAYNSGQQRITNALLHLPTDTHYTFNPDESRKYLNALHGQQQAVPLQTPNSNLETQNCYVHLITRSESADWIKKTGEVESAFERYFRGWKIEEVADLTIEDGTRLRIWQAQRTKEDE